MPIELVRDDIDHTKCARIVHQRVVIMGIESETKTHEDTKAGRVYATSTCKVVIEATEPNIVLTPAEARELRRALSYAAMLADQHTKYIRGELTFRIFGDESNALLQYHGETMRLRKQGPPCSGRHYRTCSHCRERVTVASWVTERTTDKGWGPRKRVGEYRICLDCFPKLITERPTGPRAVK